MCGGTCPGVGATALTCESNSGPKDEGRYPSDALIDSPTRPPIVFLNLSYLKLSYFELRLRAWHWGQIRQIHNEFQSPTKESGMDSHWIPVFFSRFFWHSSLFKLTVFCRCNSNQCSDVIWLMRQPIWILVDAVDRKGFHFQYKRQLIKCCASQSSDQI